MANNIGIERMSSSCIFFRPGLSFLHFKSTSYEFSIISHAQRCTQVARITTLIIIVSQTIVAVYKTTVITDVIDIWGQWITALSKCGSIRG